MSLTVISLSCLYIYIVLLHHIVCLTNCITAGSIHKHTIQACLSDKLLHVCFFQIPTHCRLQRHMMACSDNLYKLIDKMATPMSEQNHKQFYDECQVVIVDLKDGLARVPRTKTKK